jgi:hypothetical protein
MRQRAPVLLVLGADVGLAARQVREPRADAGGLLGVARIRVRGVGGLDHLEGAVDVLAVELEAHRLQDRVVVLRVGPEARERPRGRVAPGHQATRRSAMPGTASRRAFRSSVSR